MMRPVAASITLIAGLLAGLVASAPAQAQDPDFLVLGAGYYDVNDDQDAADFRLEYRSDLELWFIKPWVGVEVTSDRAFYVAGGVLADIYFGARVVVTPQFGAGFYEDGDGKELGSHIEFRSGVEIGYRFDNRSRLAVGFSHISNASIDETNPGAEILSVNYAIPIDRLFGDAE